MYKPTVLLTHKHIKVIIQTKVVTPKEVKHMKPGDFKAGDVIQYYGGSLDYLIDSPELGLCINSCSKNWIESGTVMFGDELYPFFDGEGWKYCKVVGSYGEGSYKDAVDWYSSNKDSYRG